MSLHRDTNCPQRQVDQFLLDLRVWKCLKGIRHVRLLDIGQDGESPKLARLATMTDRIDSAPLPSTFHALPIGYGTL